MNARDRTDGTDTALMKQETDIHQDDDQTLDKKIYQLLVKNVFLCFISFP
jgi:hypothetical protein